MAAKGNEIIVSADPKGVFVEGIVVGTPKPGQCMYPTTAAEVGGRKTYEPAGTTGSLGMSADGDRIPILVLLADEMQGKSATDAYVSGSRIRMYAPAMGEELNVLYQNQSGTADDVAVGQKLMVDDGTGKILLTTGGGVSEPFVSLSTITDPTADELLHVMYTGH